MRPIIKINDYRPTIVDIAGFSETIFNDIVTDWHDSFDEEYQLENGLRVYVETHTYDRDIKLKEVQISDALADFSPHDYSGLEMQIKGHLDDLLYDYNKEQEEAYNDEVEHYNDIVNTYPH